MASIASSAIGSATKGGGGGNSGAYANALKANANKYIGPYTDQSFWNMDPSQMAMQSEMFGVAQAPMINQANMTQLQSMLNQAFPGYQSMFGQASTNAQQLMAGQIPADVSQQIQRTAAQTGLASGVGGPMTKSATARDLGLTSLNLQQQGTAQFGNLMTMARNYMMPQPVDPTSLLPLSDLINTTEWSKSGQFQANEAMYTALSNAAAAQFGAPASTSGASSAGSMGGGISSLLSSLFSNMGGGSSYMGGGGSLQAPTNLSVSSG